MSNLEGRRIFVREKLWRDSGIVLDKKDDNERFGELVTQAISKLDLEHLNKDELCIQAANSLRAQGAKHRDIALFLCILERSIDVLEVAEREREELIILLEQEVEVEDAIKDPDERDEMYIAHLKQQVFALRSKRISRIVEVVREYAPNALEEAETRKSRFDGELVRTMLDHHKGNRKFTENFRNQLQTLLGLSDRSITSMKAWRTGELKGAASTLDEILNSCRNKVAIEKDESEAGDDQVLAKKEQAENKAIDELYSNIEPNYLAAIQSLQPTNLSYDESGFTKEQRKWIYALIILGCEKDSDKKKIRTLLAEKIFNCSKQKIGAVTAYLSGKLREKAKEKQSEIWQEIEAVEALKTASGAQEPQHISAKPKVASGEHFEYDNEAKIEWRQALQKFIEKSTDPEKRDEMRVLCMPGKKCLEIPVYTELGFNPTNIVGVEGGDAEARAEFEENGKKLGIETRLGRLEKGVLADEAPFDVVSLDFLGQMCPTYMEVISSIPYADKFALSLNVMGKREALKKEYQYLNLPNVVDADTNLDPFQLEKSFSSAFQNTMSLVEGTISPKETKDTREVAILNIIMLALSASFPTIFEEYRIAAKQTASHGWEIFNEDYAVKSQLSLAWHGPKAMFSILFQLDPEILERGLSSIVKRAWFRFPKLLEHETYKYQSGKSPFMSHFISGESCLPVLKKVEEVARYCLGTYSEIFESRSSDGPNMSLPDRFSAIKETKDELEALGKKMKLGMQIMDTIQNGIRGPGDLKKIEMLAIAAGLSSHKKKRKGKKGPKIKRNKRGIKGVTNVFSPGTLERSILNLKGAKSEVVSMQAGTSIHGMEAAFLGGGRDAISITQTFKGVTSSLKQSDIVAALETIQEFDADDIFLK